MGKYQSARLKRAYAAYKERMDLCATIARTLANVLLYYRLFKTSLFIRQGTFYKCSGRVLIIMVFHSTVLTARIKKEKKTNKEN